MTRYLGELGQRCRLKAATVLCAPLELKQMSAQYVVTHCLYTSRADAGPKT